MKAEEERQRVLKGIEERKAKGDSANEPISLETEKIFDPEFEQPAPGSILDDPIMAYADRIMDGLKDMMPTPMVYDPPLSEHKVRIFRLNDRASLGQIENAIEEYLNNGYRGFPTVVNDFVIMDFSRRKEAEKDGRNTG